MTYRADTGEEMVIASSFPKVMPCPEDYMNRQDQSRLNRQHEDIKALMLDGAWRTVKEVSQLLNYDENSVSAQIRHLRKPQFGGWLVLRRRRKDVGVSEYSVKSPVKKCDFQMALPGIPQVPDYSLYGG